MTRREVVLKLLCEERNKLYEQLSDEERGQAYIRACHLADPEELQEAFLEAIQLNWEMPGPGGYTDETGDWNKPVVEPYESDRVVLERLLQDMNLPTEVRIMAMREIIAEREPVEPMAAEADKAADAA
jgi:hypothetical protein